MALNNKHHFSFIDLFAGIGGLRLGFEKQGGRCVFTSEWNKYANLTYRANFQDEHEIAGDITRVEVGDIPDHDILLAGFPCQPFSIAGVSKKNSLGRAHGFACNTQGTLFFDVARIIEAKGRVPQHRERIFIVRYLTGKKGKVHEKYILSDKLWSYLQNYAAKHKAQGNGFGLVKPDSVARTLSARYYKDGSEILVSRGRYNPRRLTPEECARLMGYPDDFKIPVSDTQAYKQFGNSVVVPVIEDIARIMLPQLGKH